jgi:predicted NAD/FAD-binding protein
MSIVKLNNRGIRSATAVGTTTQLGNMVFIKKLTASSSSTLSFVDGASSVVLDDTYKEYIFTFKDIHPATNNTGFMFNMSIDSGSNYNVTKTTTNFRAYHAEGGDGQDLRYETTTDLAQSTAFQDLSREDSGNDNDECIAGYLHLFNPSSTTFVKHFIATTNSTHEADYSHQNFVAGYGNTTSAVDAVQFKMSSGNIDAGDICLYGIN